MPYKISNLTRNPYILPITGTRIKRSVKHRSLEGQVVEEVVEEHIPAVVESITLEGSGRNRRDTYSIIVDDEKMENLKANEAFMNLARAGQIRFEKAD
jgi:hypothetical protein